MRPSTATFVLFTILSVRFSTCIKETPVRQAINWTIELATLLKNDQNNWYVTVTKLWNHPKAYKSLSMQLSGALRSVDAFIRQQATDSETDQKVVHFLQHIDLFPSNMPKAQKKMSKFKANLVDQDLKGFTTSYKPPAMTMFHKNDGYTYQIMKALFGDDDEDHRILFKKITKDKNKVFWKVNTTNLLEDITKQCFERNCFDESEIYKKRDFLKNDKDNEKMPEWVELYRQRMKVLFFQLFLKEIDLTTSSCWSCVKNNPCKVGCLLITGVVIVATLAYLIYFNRMYFKYLDLPDWWKNLWVTTLKPTELPSVRTTTAHNLHVLLFDYFGYILLALVVLVATVWFGLWVLRRYKKSHEKEEPKPVVQKTSKKLKKKKKTSIEQSETESNVKPEVRKAPKRIKKLKKVKVESDNVESMVKPTRKVKPNKEFLKRHKKVKNLERPKVVKKMSPGQVNRKNPQRNLQPSSEASSTT